MLEAQLCKFQKFEPMRVHRSAITNAPYNPRVIDQRAKAKLTKNLKKVGLVEALSWNKQTGHLLSGHQRLAILDALTGHGNYQLDVAAVDMPLKLEREQNVFLNNPSAHGDWDMTALATLFKHEDFDTAASGWDKLDLEATFTDADLAGIFKQDEASAKVLAELGGVGAIRSDAQFIPGTTEPAPAFGEDEVGDGEQGDAEIDMSEAPDAAEDPDAQARGAAAAFAPRRSDVVKEYMTQRDAANDTELYAVVVFETRREREIFMAAMGQNKDTRYIDGERVFAKLGIDPKAEWAEEFGAGAAT